MDFTQLPISSIGTNILNFFKKSSLTFEDGEFIKPEFTYNGTVSCDLFGILDAYLTFFILNKDNSIIKKINPVEWFDKILSFQSDDFYFMPGDYTFHVKEHSTAYAISILKLIASLDKECTRKFESLEIPSFYLELVKDEKRFFKWFKQMGLKMPSIKLKKGIKYILRINSKYLGWHNIWPSSHIGGGIPAYLSMTKSILLNKYEFDEKLIDHFFENYFNSLNKICDKNTGVWKQGLFDLIYPNVTHRDIGGAVHFYWVYDYENKKYLYPNELIKSCIKFQNETGLIKDKPYCIDFDFTYLINRSMIQLEDRHAEKNKIDKYMYKNYMGIIQFYSDEDNFKKLENTHSIPGALASLIEIEDYFVRNKIFECNQFEKPFDTICWL